MDVSLNPSSCESTTSAACSNVNKKKQKVKLSTDPQSVAARQRRHRISDRFKILQSLVPGGAKMDTVSMLEEAIQYVKFLKAQIWLHQAIISSVDHNAHDPDLTFIPGLPSSHHQHLYLYNYRSYSGDQVQEEAPLGLPDSWFTM